jgi:hypothetical protein
MRMLVAALLIVLAGCAGKEGGKGKPAAAGFNLSGPSGPVEVLNGQTKRLPLEVQWKSGPREDVKLSATVEPADRGVSVKIEPDVLPGGERKAEVVIRSGETAPAGEYKVTVTGKAAKAGTATREITVKVPPIE